MRRHVLRMAIAAGLAVPIALVGFLLLRNQSTPISDAIDEHDTQQYVGATSPTVDSSKPPNPSAGTGPQRIKNDPATRHDRRPLGWPTFEEVEQRFALEQRDAAWSDTAESGILGILSLIPDLGLVQVDVECRVTLCRLRLLFPPGTETTFAIRSIYALSDSIGLGPVSADTRIDSGNLPLLRLFLRRKIA